MSSSSSANSTSIQSTDSPVSTSNTTLDDIQYLLYLESLKRFKDGDINIRRQVDEKTRQYQEARNEYIHLYAEYVNLVKLCMTRNVLEQGSNLNDSHIELSKHSAQKIIERLSTSNKIEYINPRTLDLMKTMLSNTKSYENLEVVQKEVVEDRVAVRNIQTTAEITESTVESSIVQGFNHFLSEIQIENFTK